MSWIRQQIENKGISQAQLAEAIGLTPVQLNKTLTGNRVLQSTEADRIRKFLGYRLPEDPKPIVAVAGQVGAGAKVPLEDYFHKGEGLYKVYAPDILQGKSVVAVEITGDSMAPVYDDGDLLFYQRNFVSVPSEFINHNCVCCDENGDVWIKRLKLGSKPGLFHLISINPTADSIHDIHLEWAARVMLHLPKDMVEVA